MYYAAIGTIAVLIHLILNHEYFSNHEQKNEVNKAFKRYIWAALAYYITDAFWGVIYEWHIPLLIYIDTILYYVAMAATVVLLCRYVTTYLKLDTKFGKLIRYFGQAFGIFEISILIINHFHHIFFWIDSEATYHAYAMRYVALYMQVFLCVLLAVQTGTVLKKTTGEMKKRYFTIFMFCLEMTVAIVVQILYPLLPVYSVGLLVGICIIYTFVKESEREEQYKVLSSMADVFYSMHVIDLVSDSFVVFNARNEVNVIADPSKKATDMMREVMSAVTTDEHKEMALQFTELTTLADRMKNKKAISAEFIGKHIGWFIGMFITIESDEEGKPTKVIYTTREIEEQKKQEERLIRKSQTDDMTGISNRRAYEEAMEELNKASDEYIYIALDVNGLKVVNDTIGHQAGDELIIGASMCMSKVLGAYGNVYRTGGDEFVAIVRVKEEELQKILEEFDDEVSNWSGHLLDSMSVSYGYVSSTEHPEYSAQQLAVEADKRMYIAKAEYYRKKGIDRRGQQDAHRALCEAYTKILKINLSNDSYQIINMDMTEQTTSKGFSDKISDWLTSFGKSGQVHPDDLDEYLKKTDISYIENYFSQGKTALLIFYRRRFGDDFKLAMMEIMPTNDYSDNNHSYFLYVKDIDSQSDNK